MSEEALKRFLERLNSDEAFRERMRTDWEDAIDELGLSETELVALSTQDEDALRRLTGAEVAGYSLDFRWIAVSAYCTMSGCRLASNACATAAGCPSTSSGTGVNCCAR